MSLFLFKHPAHVFSKFCDSLRSRTAKKHGWQRLWKLTIHRGFSTSIGLPEATFFWLIDVDSINGLP
jgi:hypothetical protein